MAAKSVVKSKAPKYQLTYFDARGRAECIRLAFAAADVAYEDKRVNRADWAQLKQQQPMGVLPVLQCGKQVLSQSRAILGFIAREHDLYGESNWEAALVDQFLGGIDDLLKPLTDAIMERDNNKQALKVKALKEKVLPGLLRSLEAITHSEKHIVGESLTIADLCWFDVSEKLQQIGENLVDFAKLSGVLETVRALPGVDRWLEQRQDTLISEASDKGTATEEVKGRTK